MISAILNLSKHNVSENREYISYDALYVVHWTIILAVEEHRQLEMLNSCQYLE